MGAYCGDFSFFLLLFWSCLTTKNVFRERGKWKFLMWDKAVEGVETFSLNLFIRSHGGLRAEAARVNVDLTLERMNESKLSQDRWKAGIDLKVCVRASLVQEVKMRTFRKVRSSHETIKTKNVKSLAECEWEFHSKIARQWKVVVAWKASERVFCVWYARGQQSYKVEQKAFIFPAWRRPHPKLYPQWLWGGLKNINLCFSSLIRLTFF